MPISDDRGAELSEIEGAEGPQSAPPERASGGGPADDGADRAGDGPPSPGVVPTGAAQSGAEQPGTDQPGTDQPGPDQPDIAPSGVERPGGEQSSHEHSKVQLIDGEQLGTEDAALERSTPARSMINRPERPARPDTGALVSWPKPEPPARPARTSYLRSPLDDLPAPAPRSVRLSLWAWIASCVPAALAIVLTLYRLTEVRAHLRATALAETPDLTAASLLRIVNVTIWIALAALLVPIILQVVLAVVMFNRGNWARFVLPVIGLAALPAAVIAIDALSDETAVTNHSNMIIGVSVQGALMLTAAVLMFMPSANHWFRTRRRGRR